MSRMTSSRSPGVRWSADPARQLLADAAEPAVSGPGRRGRSRPARRRRARVDPSSLAATSSSASETGLGSIGASWRSPASRSARPSLRPRGRARARPQSVASESQSWHHKQQRPLTRSPVWSIRRLEGRRVVDDRQRLVELEGDLVAAGDQWSRSRGSRGRRHRRVRRGCRAGRETGFRPRTRRRSDAGAVRMQARWAPQRAHPREGARWAQTGPERTIAVGTPSGRWSRGRPEPLPWPHRTSGTATGGEIRQELSRPTASPFR